jgi:hypothetical protein
MGADDPAESRVTLADLAEDLVRLGSRVDQGRFSRSRFCDQVTEDPEMTYQDLIDLKAHVLLLSPFWRLKKRPKSQRNVFFS